MPKKKTFEDRMLELEKIIEQLEEGEVDLESAVDHYQKGVTLHKALKGELDKMEKKVEILTGDGDETRDFEHNDGESS